VSLFLIANCGKSVKEEPAATQPPKLERMSFRLKWFVYSAFATHIVALDRGYYREQGLDVDIRPGGPGMDPIRLVATGVDDVGLADYLQIITAREKGIPVVAIGEDYIRSGAGLFALKTSGIATPKDFEGRKVGIMPGTDKHALYLALLTKEHVDRKRITEIPVAFDSTLLLNGTIDVIPGWITKDPFVFEERGAPVNVIDPYDYGLRPGGNVYFTSEDTLRKKRDLLKRFLRGTLKGIIEAPKMPDNAVVGMVLKHNPKLAKDAEVKIWVSSKNVLLEKDVSKVGLMYPTKWEETQKLGREYGLLKKDVDLTRCFTNDLVTEIHREGFPGQ
jgi:ABC-type nitrate/sulfonate/bicarbonate transport system substrate-binding protein